jgi:pimeloyl-ACP methyl ester carboxylesterase
MNERFARLGDVELCYEALGDPTGQPLLLVMGLGGPLIWWDDDLCQMLVDSGFYVVRFDNRDCGRSTRIEGVARPRVMRALLGSGRSASYLLDDMAGDAVGLLDQLELSSAHVMGVSMGGMIAQALAIGHPGRVRSLVTIMSTTGARTVGWPSPRVVPLLTRRPPRGREGYVEFTVKMWRIIGSPGFPFDEQRIRRRAEATWDRGVDPVATARQLVAITSSGDRTPALRRLRLPALVVHGKKDPLVHVSGGVATARAIPGAELEVIDGMGHDMPPQLWQRLVDGVARTSERASERAPA